MPQCVTCKQFVHVDLCIVVNEVKNDVQCVFCKVGKDYITVVDKKTKQERKITKIDAIEKYKLYCDKIFHKPNVQKLVNPESKIIRP